MKEFEHQGHQGFSIAARSWIPEGEVRAIVQVVHGMVEHCGRYARLAQFLNEKGVALYAHDQRGHGKSADDADYGHMGDADTYEAALSDIELLLKHIRSEHVDVPLILMGHSMGSFFVQELALRQKRIEGMILSGSNGPIGALGTAARTLARVERKRLGKRGKSNLLQTLSFGSFNKKFKPARTEMDWLSRDEKEVDKYLDDDRCGGPITTQSWVDFLAGLNKLNDKKRYRQIEHKVPVYLFSGARDPVSNSGKGVHALVDLYKNAGFERVEYKLYDEGRHEMLNDIVRDDVHQDLLNFVESIVGA